jgi:preprotein translocase subunit YajC
MKKANLITAIVALSVLASTTPAAALSLGASTDTSINTSIYGTNTSVNTNTDVKANGWKQDDKRETSVSSESRLDASKEYWKNWMYNAGTTGTVTATSDDSITIKASNGTTYTVDISDAQIRGATANSIENGDKVYIQGVTNGTNIVATLVIDGKAKTAAPSDDDKRTAVVGTVTAKSGSTLTVLGKNGMSYTVATANAMIWADGSQSSSVSNIDVGDSVIIQGTISGSSVTAAKVYGVTLPSTAANGGIRGTVTAVNNDSFTLMVSGGTTYTVNTDDADFKDRKGGDEDRNELKVGETVIVSGDVSGSTIDADMVSEAKVNTGFFHKVGNFFKNLFGKKSVNSSSSIDAESR